MRIYDMRCTHELCGRTFDWHTKPDVYNNSKKDGFRDVSCLSCGRRGAKRAFTSAPADLTVKGTWGRTASPELKGKSYYTKQERDRQLAASGTSVNGDGSSVGVFKKKKDAVTTDTRDSARDAIEALLSENGKMRLKDIIEDSGLTHKIVHEVVYKDPGRIVKVGWGTYGLTGVSYPKEASV
tara:strand:+ start:3065 stop:3610 length:546 start_codon:yes stop_codon:yes gene_type:complete